MVLFCSFLWYNALSQTFSLGSVIVWNPFSKKKRNYLGLDIGTSSIKLVELGGRKKNPELLNYASCKKEIGPERGHRNDQGFLSLSDEELADLFERLLAKVEIDADMGAISVPIYSTFSTTIVLPQNISDNDIESAIRFEAKKYVPVPISEVMIEWHFISSSKKNLEDKTGKSKKVGRKVFVIAIPQEMVDKYRELGQKVPNLDVELLEIEIFSLARILYANGRRGRQLVVDIGGKNTNVTFLKNGTIQNTFNIEISGEDLTRTLMTARNIDFEQAEKLKKTKGFDDSKIKSTLDSQLEDLALRIKRKLNQSDFSGGDYEVVLSGGAVKMDGLKEYFGKQLGTEVEVINPWEGIDYPEKLSERLKKIGSNYGVAVGLALRGLS